jgi:DNA-binding response OmpR family regulator
MTYKGKILVVDDEESNRKVLDKYLTQEDYKVECASCGLEGGGALKGNGTYSGLDEYVGYVLDQRLGDELSGSNLACLIRIDQKEVPIVLLTASPREVDMVLLRGYKNIYVLHKPVDMEEIGGIFQKYHQEKGPQQYPTNNL